jgi:hypothetical protein
MEAGNPAGEPVPSKPLYCRAEPCPVDGRLGAFLANGGCIFCRGGLCSASPRTFTLFSIPAAKPAPATPSCCETETRPLPDAP